MSADRAHAGPDAGIHAAADRRWMEVALEEARIAAEEDEVPVGAVVVHEGTILGRAHNRTRALRDPTAHAEMLAISQASRGSGAMRLPGSLLYTTVEPCFMCAGALVHARVRRVVWAVRDPKFGGCASLGAVLDAPGSNHAVEHAEGVCAEEARALLVEFFQRTRRGARAADRTGFENQRVPFGAPGVQIPPSPPVT